MHIPKHFFGPILKSRGGDGHPIVQSLNKGLRALCESRLDPESPGFIDYEDRKADFWDTRRGGRILPKVIEQLAIGGLVLDARYGEAACGIFRAIVENEIAEKCGGFNYGRPYHTWRDNCLDAGASSLGLAMGLDLLRDALSPEELHRFGTYVLPFVDYLLEDPPDVEEKRPDWNMAAIGLVGLGLLSLVLRSLGVLDEDRFERAMVLSKRRCCLFLEKGHDGEGAFFEGPAYGGATVHFMAPLVFALARCGDRELADHPGWGLLVDGLVHELIPSTGRPNVLNDCSDQFSVDWLALVASEQKSGLAQWLWQSIDHPPEDGSDWRAPDDAWSDTVTRYLLYFDPSIVPTSPDELTYSKVKHFKNRGLVDIRSGWQQDDFFLSFLCDVFPAGGHRQADRNQFALHALGESFAIDSGYALERLPDTTEVLRLGALGEAHNLPLIHGEMQRRGMVKDDGIKAAMLDGLCPYLESEAGESYASANRFTRRVVCLPTESDDLGAVVIVDRLTFDMRERPMLSWLLHTHEINTLAVERDRFTITGGRFGNLCDVQMVTPWPGRWKQETFLDHPRVRYDWFWDSLFCIVALVPYAKNTPPPEMTVAGRAEGCALSFRHLDVVDTLLTVAPDQKFAFEGIETDAEFVHVRREKDQMVDYRISGGTRLMVDDYSVHV